MKWFFALNQASLEQDRHFWESMISVAVKSAQENTSLQPNFIFDGDDDPFLENLSRMGVKIIKHQVSFHDALMSRQFEYPPEDAMRRHYVKIASGAYLRTEIPEIEKDASVILYTDCDVMFEADPVPYIDTPTFFACAPEINKENWDAFNTGVMAMNLHTLRQGLPSFVNFIRKNLQQLHVWDQSAYQMHYAGKADRLPLELNWKPYWGVSDSAVIVHFHGPKPNVIDSIINNQNNTIQQIYKELVAINPESYRHYLEKWHSYNKDFT